MTQALRICPYEALEEAWPLEAAAARDYRQQPTRDPTSAGLAPKMMYKSPLCPLPLTLFVFGHLVNLKRYRED